MNSDLLAQASSDSLKKHVVKLTSYPLSRSILHKEYLDKANSYITQQFENHCNKVIKQEYEINGEVFSNIIASFGPDTGARMIIGGHYDSYEGSPGADANASGIAGLIELSRMLSKIEKKLNYRIDIVAYTLGEMPVKGTQGMGSYIHAKSMFDNNTAVMGMLDIDGIGFYTDISSTQKYPYFGYRIIHGRRANFIALIQNPGNGLWGRKMKGLLKQYAQGVKVKNFKPIVPFEGFNDGNFMNYNQFGISAIKITNTSFYRNNYYHYDVDTYQTLDYFRMSKVMNMIYTSLIRYRPR